MKIFSYKIVPSVFRFRRAELIILLFVLCSANITAQSSYYVAPTGGNDSFTGTKTQPFATITKAITVAAAGDTIYLRGGIYSLSATISLSKAGTGNSYYHLFAYPGEKPVLDFSRQTSSDGIKVNSQYWHLKGIEVQYAAHNGIAINGSYNLIENCCTHDNRDSGTQLGNGASYNRIINCDSYYNADPPDYGDADGFAPKLDVGTGNYFYGCRSWGNCDDGWDGYLRPATNVTTILENCWTWGNGYLKNGTDPGSQANGNGFKMGGGDNSNSQHLMHHFILRNCLAFYNKVKGFDQNNNDGSMTLLNCTGFGNKAENYKITRPVNAGQTVIVQNSISMNSTVGLGSFVVQQTNSWNSPFTVTTGDFVSVDTTGVSGPRKTDGSLPDITFMHLSPGSGLIDAGVDVGIKYTGSKPDLGAFEFGMAMPTSVISDIEIPTEFRLEQNYPNPFNPTTVITYQLPLSGNVSLKIYDILGREAATLVDEFQPAGIHHAQFSTLNSKLASSVYVYRIVTGDFVQSKKMILLK